MVSEESSMPHLPSALARAVGLIEVADRERDVTETLFESQRFSDVTRSVGPRGDHRRASRGAAGNAAVLLLLRPLFLS